MLGWLNRAINTVAVNTGAALAGQTAAGRRRRSARLAALLAPALIAAAIAPAAQAAELRVGFIPVAGIAQLFVTEGAGWAAQEGLSLKPTQFDSGPAMINAFVSGTLDAYYGGVGPVLVAAGRGIPVRVVAATAINELVLVGRGDFAGLAATDPAAAFKAFHAKTGRPVKLAAQPAGSVPDTVLRYWLVKVAKLDPADYSITAMGIDQTQQALLAGAVDGAVVREPALTVVLNRDPATRLLVPGGQLLPNQPGSVLAVTEDLVKRDPDTVAKLVALHIRATQLLRDQPKSAAPWLQRTLGKGMIDIPTLEQALTSPASQYLADPLAIRAATGIMQDFQREIGVLEQSADLDKLFDNSFFVKAGGKPGQ